MRKLSRVGALVVISFATLFLFYTIFNQIDFLQEKLLESRYEIMYYQNRLQLCNADYDTITGSISVNVVATCYHAVAAQCNADYLHTADMTDVHPTNPIEQRIIAISRDLIDRGFSMGDTVYISNTIHYDGVWYIHDKMNKRFTNRIDFLVNKDSYIDLFKSVTITKFI